MKVQLEQIGNQFCVSVKDGWFSNKKYVDLRDRSYKWSRKDKHFKDCLTTKEEAEEVFNLMASKAKVIYSVIL